MNIYVYVYYMNVPPQQYGGPQGQGQVYLTIHSRNIAILYVYICMYSYVYEYLCICILYECASSAIWWTSGTGTGISYYLYY
jgi:hypothetical protein